MDETARVPVVPVGSVLKVNIKLAIRCRSGSCSGATANLPLAGYFSDATYAKGHATNLAAFRAALLKAQSNGSMSAPLQSALTKYDHLNVQEASLVTLGTYPTSLQEPDLQRIANLMFTFNTEPSGTTGTLSVSSMIFH